jgi:phage gpG-like protein
MANIILEHNVEELQEALTDALARLPQLRRRIARMATTRFAARSTSTYMQDGPKVRQPGNDGPLIKQSGRLATAVRGGAGSKNRVEVSGRTINFIIEIFVPYAAIHEFGGEIRIPVTVKMRQFFWAMWYDTQDEKWKFMALTKKTVFIVKMPKRAYIQPALDDEQDEIRFRALNIVVEFLNQELP